MKISVIVPAFNEEKFIARALRKIKAATGAFSLLGWESEIIVCDNNSTDRTAEKARAAGATVVFEPVNQISRARNTGAAAATGDWLVFVDADSYPSRELFADLASVIQSGRCLGGGAVVAMDRAIGWTGVFIRNGPRDRLDGGFHPRLERDQPDKTLGGRLVCLL